MAAGEIFLWGMVGGLLFYFLEFIPLRFERSEIVLTPWRLMAVLMIAAIYLLIGGTLAWLLLDGSNVQRSVAVVVGFAGAALLPQFAGMTAEKHVGKETGINSQPRNTLKKTEESDTRRSQPGRIRAALKWWTAPRIQAACAIGVFTVALLTYITK